MTTKYRSPPKIDQVSCLEVKSKRTGDGHFLGWTIAYEDAEGNAMGGVRVGWHHDPEIEVLLQMLHEKIEEKFVERSSGHSADAVLFADHIEDGDEPGIEFKPPA